MKRNTYIFIVCVISLLSFYIGKSITKQEKCHRTTVRYKEIEEKTDSVCFRVEDLTRFRFTPERYKEGMIPDAASAATIAYDYVTAVYGEECAIKEQPYYVQLINNKVWGIDGHLPEKSMGGTFHLSIEKYTGKILTIMHDK